MININEDQIHSGESPKEYRARLLRTIQSGDITSMDRHDRVHGALAFTQDIQSQYPGHALNVVVRHFLKKGGESNAQGLIVTGIDSRGKNLTGHPTGAGGTSTRHRAEVAAELKNITGLHVSRYPFLNPQHLSVLTRLMDFKGLREMYEQALNEEKQKKPYKGFVKGKNHPEGGLSRKEAHRQGIHAGIETKDEAKRKGGFGKLSGKTQARRKSFCARMCGMKRRNTSSKTANDPKSKINAALRVWGCRCGTNESYETETTMLNERRSVRELIEGKIKNFLISEMAQTAERKAEMKAKIATTSEKEKRAGDRAAKADDRKEIGPHTMDYGSNGYQKIAARHRAAQDDRVNVIVQDAKEKKDETKLYGKGGKVVAVRKWSPVKKAKKPVKEEFITMILEKKKMGDPCWKGYTAKGTKMKNGRQVPNCVPISENTMTPLQEAYARAKHAIKEEVVNSKHKGTMSSKEKRQRDSLAKGLKGIKSIKGKPDSEKEAKYRYATYLILKKRGGGKSEKNNKSDAPSKSAKKRKKSK